MQATRSAALSVPSVVAHVVKGVVKPAGRWLGAQMAPLLGPLSRPGVPLALAIVGVLAGVSAAARLKSGPINGEALMAGAIAILAFALALAPWLAGRSKVKLPPHLAKTVAAIPASVWRTLRIAVVALLGLGGAALALGAMKVRMPSLAGLPLIGGKTIEGRAVAAGGDVVRVNSTLVRLSGIDAPESAQKCTAGKKTARCAEAAQEALSRAVRGKAIRCDVRGTDDAGRAIGTCVAGNDDIAERIVREGFAFSAGGWPFSRYGSAESEARAQKAGLWRSSDVERPADFRAKMWETAKKAAPDGCPIKGQIASERRTYVLPWAPDYDRIKVRTTKGERWFCSEAEAAGAGWKPADRG